MLLVGPVGAGKTLVAELLIRLALKHEWAQVFYNANRETLISQPAQGFDDVAYTFVKAGQDFDATAVLQFCQVQTIARRQIVAVKDSSGKPYRRALVIWDEAHAIKAQQCLGVREALLKTFDHVYFAMFSATPYRLDSRGLGDVADCLVEIATPKQLMEASPPIILNPHYWSQPPPIAEGEDTEQAMFRPGIVGDIFATWLKHARDLPTIGRAYSIPHSQMLTQRFNNGGVKAAHIDGSMSTVMKRRLFVGLAVGVIQVLWAGSNVFDEGFDSRASWEMLLPRGSDATEALTLLRDGTLELGCAEAKLLRERVLAGVLRELREFYGEDAWEPPPYKPLACLIDAAPTASCGSWMQRQGRVVRSWPGKDRAIVICHSGNLERHGFLAQHEGFALTQDQQWSPKLRPSTGIAGLHVAKPVTCPGCLCVDVAGTTQCRYCGAVISTPKLPDEDASIELVEKSVETTPMLASTPGVREAFLKARYKEQAAANRQRLAQGKPPYKEIWAALRFKKRFGHWPDGAMDRMLKRQFGIG